MATTVLYRVSGGEVVKISVKGQTFADRNATYWGVLTDPTFSDGQVCRDPNGDLRVLGYAKINASGTIRNAIQSEIDTFVGFETADENLQDKEGAKDLFDLHPQFRKLETARANIIIKELNILREWDRDFQAAVAEAGNLGQLQTAVAALPSLTDRILAQFKTQIKAAISEND